LGTGNNVARGLGLAAIRAPGTEPVARTISAITGGRTRDLDVGRANGEPFVGSFAIGMDGAILALRNRWRARGGVAALAGGYPLYLLSCAANLGRHRRVNAALVADGVARSQPVYGAVVTNTPIYAGEFCFDDGD